MSQDHVQDPQPIGSLTHWILSIGSWPLARPPLWHELTLAGDVNRGLLLLLYCLLSFSSSPLLLLLLLISSF